MEGNRRSSFGPLFSGKRRQHRDAVVEPKSPNVEHWLQLCAVGNYRELWRSLADHLSYRVPCTYVVNAAQPWDIALNQSDLNAQLVYPLTALLSNDAKATDLTEFASRIGVSVHTRKPGQICGRMFKSGEAVYSCKECANDPTCVMCQECFLNSGHKDHRYNVDMHASGGSGYCDCGDEEAWSQHVHCELHKPVEEDMEVDQEEQCPLEDAHYQRMSNVVHMLLSYCIRMFCTDAMDVVPPPLMLSSTPPTPAMEEHPCLTVLFNDETHTYDGVIRALELSIQCTEQQAMLLATIVDREGRSCVRAGSKDWCQKAKAELERKTAKDRNKHTGKSGPLVVKVINSVLFAHQNFAIHLMTQLCQWIQAFPPLRKIVSEILLNRSYFVTDVADDDVSHKDGITLAEKMLLRDRKLWKGARVSVHSLLMATVLMDADTKVQFSVLFTQLYPLLMLDFLDDDHEHGSSIVALTVQMYTVPTLARRLIAQHNALSILLECFLTNTRHYVNAESGRFDFSVNQTYPPFLRRALYISGDLKYLLNTVPAAADWTEELRTEYLHGLSCLLKYLKQVQNMDMVQRQTGVHQMYESEWETAFNMQLRFEEVISMFIYWVSTDIDVAREAVKLAVAAVASELKRGPENGMKLDHVELELPEGKHNLCATVVQYDVSEQPVSVHIPLCRLLAALYSRYVAFDNAPPLHLCTLLLEQIDVQSSAVLMELPIRVAVLTAQAQAGMWRRNGYALLNQIHNYYSPLCRSEMYDRDVLMMQIAASLMKPNDFLLRCLYKFNLNRWAQNNYEETLSPDELSKLVVVQAEELIQWLIVVIGERYHYGVSSASIQDYVKREVIHLLCKGPTPYSKIQKRLCFDPMLEKLAIEDTVKQVAIFKKPSGTAAGVFELKEEYREQYNPFFFHYSKADVSAAEQHQQKDRKHWLPPVPPPFKEAFAPIKSLCTCDTMMQLLTITLERSTRRSRFSSDGLLHRTVYLIGMALNEQMADVSGQPFTKVAEQWAADTGQPSLIALMNKLNGSLEAVAISDLLKAVIKRYNDAASRLRALESGDAGHEMEVDGQEAAETNENVVDEKEEKARLKRIAAEKRKKAMEQMQRLQKNFSKQNQALLAEEDLDDDPTDESCDSYKLVNDGQFPVALGAHRQDVEVGRSRSVTCILCQECELVQPDGRPMVYATFVQPSAMFSASHRPETDPSTVNTESLSSSSKSKSSSKSSGSNKQPDPLYMMADHFSVQPVHVSTCSHIMHLQCYTEYHESQKSPGRRQNLYVGSRLIKVEEGEYQCPLCKRLSNAALPVLAPINRWNFVVRPGISTSPHPVSHDVNVVAFKQWLRHAHQTAFKAVITNSPHVKHRIRRKHRSGPTSSDPPLATSAPTPKEDRPHRRTAAAVAALRKRTYSATAQSTSTGTSSYIAATGAAASGQTASPSTADTATPPRPNNADREANVDELDVGAFEVVQPQQQNDDEESDILVETLLRQAAHFEDQDDDDDDDDSTQYSTADEGELVESGESDDDFDAPERLPDVLMEEEVDRQQEDRAVRAAGAQVAEIMANQQGGGGAMRHARDVMRQIVPFMSSLFPTSASSSSTRVRPRDERVPPRLFEPNNINYWMAISAYASAASNHGQSASASTLINSIVLLWQSCAYTIRCLVVVNKFEAKPLFGAHNVRQSDCLYAVCRVASAASCLLRTSRIRWLNARLMSVVLRPTDQCPAVVDLDMWTWMVCATYCTSTNTLNSSASGHVLSLNGQTEAHLLRLSLTALMFQVIVGYSPKKHESVTETTPPSSSSTSISSRRAELLRCVSTACTCATCEFAIRQACVDAALDHLRSAALFWHAVTNVPPPESLKDPSIDELPSICRYLGLPTQSDALLDLLFGYESVDLMRRWSEHRRVRQLYSAASSGASGGSAVVHPAPIIRQPLQPNTLIDLPKNFHELINKAVTFSCPMLNSDDGTRAPTLCLLCGAMLCSQSYCCQRTITVPKPPPNQSSSATKQQQIGACNWHMRHCAAPTAAMFLRIRDSQILLLTSKYRGCFLPAPYVDEYGETDQGFRRGNPLSLNEELYAKLQSLWLQHGVGERVIGQYEINPQNAQIEWQHL